MNDCNCCCKIVKLTEVIVPKVTLASGNVCNCSTKKFTTLNEYLQLLL